MRFWPNAGMTLYLPHYLGLTPLSSTGNDFFLPTSGASPSTHRALSSAQLRSIPCLHVLRTNCWGTGHSVWRRPPCDIAIDGTWCTDATSLTVPDRNSKFLEGTGQPNRAPTHPQCSCSRRWEMQRCVVTVHLCCSCTGDTTTTQSWTMAMLASDVACWWTWCLGNPHWWNTIFASGSVTPNPETHTLNVDFSAATGLRPPQSHKQAWRRLPRGPSKLLPPFLVAGILCWDEILAQADSPALGHLCFQF